MKEGRRKRGREGLKEDNNAYIRTFQYLHVLPSALKVISFGHAQLAPVGVKRHKCEQLPLLYKQACETESTWK